MKENRELICLRVHPPQKKSQKERRYIGIKKNNFMQAKIRTIRRG